MLDFQRFFIHCTDMPQITLTSQQKIDLELRHKKARDARECDRIKAVLLKSEGWSTASIAQALRKNECTISRHVDDYLKTEKLMPENGGSDSLMNDEQTQQLIEHLAQCTYAHVGQIVHYIVECWGIKYTVSGLNKWLHQHGFTYKKPKGIPHKFDETKQADFINQYKTLKASLATDEVILFMDAVHPTQATKITSGWIKKGVDKTIDTTGSRTRLNIVGAIELGCLSSAIVEQFKTINGESIVSFFKRIHQTYPSKQTIHLVLDGAGYHRSQIVIDAAKELNITLHYLPPYSPNLNPIERLWKVMNEHARNNIYFESAKSFRQQITTFFDETLPEIGSSLNKRINDNFQVLKSAS